MAQTGKLAALTGAGGEFIIQEFTVPDVRPGTMIIKVELAGICATDAHVYQGHWPNLRYPVVLGHENTGTIVALGHGVDHDFLGRELNVGDRIVFKASGCGRCANCVLDSGRNSCPHAPPGYGFISPTTEIPHFTGGFGQYICLFHPYTQVFKVDLDARTAVLAEPTAVAVSGVARANIQVGDTVVIQGSGAVGLLVLACARLSGATQAIVVGGPKRRLDLARAFGADAVIDITEVSAPEERINAVRDLTPGGRGAEVVFGCVGKPSAVTEGLRFLKSGGRMIEIGNALGRGSTTIVPAADFVSPNATLTGHWATQTSHWVRALRVLQRGGFPFREIVSHQIPLTRLGDAIRSILGNYTLDGEEVIKIAVAPNEV